MLADLAGHVANALFQERAIPKAAPLQEFDFCLTRKSMLEGTQPNKNSTTSDARVQVAVKEETAT